MIFIYTIELPYPILYIDITFGPICGFELYIRCLFNNILLCWLCLVWMWIWMIWLVIYTNAFICTRRYHDMLNTPLCRIFYCWLTDNRFFWFALNNLLRTGSCFSTAFRTILSVTFRLNIIIYQRALPNFLLFTYRIQDLCQTHAKTFLWMLIQVSQSFIVEMLLILLQKNFYLQALIIYSALIVIGWYVL